MDFSTLLCVVFSYISFVSASSCLGNSVGPDVKIPQRNVLLTLDDFDAFVVNHTLGEFYYAVPSPAPYHPYINYFITFVKKNEGHYVEKTFGETQGSNSICERSEASFHPNVHVNKASFYDDSTPVLIPGTPDDIPMVSIVQDLCRATGIKFGTDSFRWFFTYGEAKICAAENLL